MMDYVPEFVILGEEDPKDGKLGEMLDYGRPFEMLVNKTDEVYMVTPLPGGGIFARRFTPAEHTKATLGNRDRALAWLDELRIGRWARKLPAPKT